MNRPNYHVEAVGSMLFVFERQIRRWCFVTMGTFVDGAVRQIDDKYVRAPQHARQRFNQQRKMSRARARQRLLIDQQRMGVGA